MWILGLKGLSPNIHIQILQTDFRTFSYIIRLKIQGRERIQVRDFIQSFFVYYQKADTPEFFIVLFFTRKVSIVIVIEGG